MSKTILVVEDNEMSMKLFCDVLKRVGYTIVCGYDGASAQSLAREYHPDLIVMDIQLPDISGIEVTRWIKQDASLSNIPVIAVTAYPMPGDEETFRSLGFDRYLRKPIVVAEFLAAIHKLLPED
jgi:two-component system cell cycle response regulator DivK